MERRDGLALKIFFIVWGISLLAYLLMISIDNSVFLLAWNNVNLLLSFSYLSFCVLLLGLGIKFGSTGIRFGSMNLYKNTYKYEHINYLKYLYKKRIDKGFSINNLLFIGLPILSFLVGILIFLTSGFTGDIESQRSVHISTEHKASSLSYLQLFTQASTMILVLFIPWIKNKSNIIKISLSLMIFIGFFLISLSNAGRITVFVNFVLPLLISSIIRLIIYGISFRPSDLLKIFVLLLSLVLLVIVFSVWQFFRSASQLDHLSNTSLLPYSTFLSPLGLDGELNSIVSFVLNDFLNYLSNGIQSFSYFFEVYEPHPLFGGYQFGFISSKFVEANAWFEWKNEVEDCYRHFGLFWNVWGSYVRDYIVDFGRFPTPFISYITGFFIGFVERRCLSKKSWFAMYVILLCWLCMSPYYSLFLIREFHVSLLMITLWIVFDSYKIRKLYKEEVED
ncbi:MAG: hypothetical protein ACK6A9_06065 [Dolichospermum sp.]|jgi:hypothetical protein